MLNAECGMQNAWYPIMDEIQVFRETDIFIEHFAFGNKNKTIRGRVS